MTRGAKAKACATSLHLILARLGQDRQKFPSCVSHPRDLIEKPNSTELHIKMKNGSTLLMNDEYLQSDMIYAAKLGNSGNR